MQRLHIKCLLLIVFGVFGVGGCSGARALRPGYSANQLLDAVCKLGETNQSVQGHLWLKAHSKEFSGQFPADVSVTAPDHLRLEITNILGGTEALIFVSGNHYEVQRGKGRNSATRSGDGSWAGIPLRWATDLFLGKIPCPDPSKKRRIQTNPEGELVVELVSSQQIAQERYIYRFLEVSDKPWPGFLKWERLVDPPVQVEFEFESPEGDTQSPKKWMAKSKSGNVRVRWSKREVNKKVDTPPPPAAH